MTKQDEVEVVMHVPFLSLADRSQIAALEMEKIRLRTSKRL